MHPVAPYIAKNPKNSCFVPDSADHYPEYLPADGNHLQTQRADTIDTFSQRRLAHQLLFPVHLLRRSCSSSRSLTATAARRADRPPKRKINEMVGSAEAGSSEPFRCGDLPNWDVADTSLLPGLSLLPILPFIFKTVGPFSKVEKHFFTFPSSRLSQNFRL